MEFRNRNQGDFRNGRRVAPDADFAFDSDSEWRHSVCRLSAAGTQPAVRGAKCFVGLKIKIKINVFLR